MKENREIANDEIRNIEAFLNKLIMYKIHNLE